MDAWLTRAQERGVVVRVPASQVRHGVYCVAHDNAWYHDGVAFDWSALHARLGSDDDSSSSRSGSCVHAVPALLAEHADALRTFGVTQLRSRGASSSSSHCLVTVIEVTAPWELQPLSSQAQQMSVFTTTAAAVTSATTTTCDNSSSSSSKALADLTFYRFQRGPPGVRGVVRDIAAALRGVAAQLQGSSSSSLCVLYCFSCFVVYSDDFATLLHHTAAVHKALKGCGLVLDMHRSCLVPRRVFWLHDKCDADCGNNKDDNNSICDDEDDVASATGWCVLPPHALTADEDVLQYIADLFFQWLHDSHYWGGGAPVRIYASLRPARANSSNNSSNNSQDANDVAMKRACACVHFVRVVVLPRAARVGLSSLRLRMPEAGGDVLQCLLPRVQCTRVLHGPQKWSALDLRLTLCQLDAYAHDPHTVLHDMLRHDHVH